MGVEEREREPGEFQLHGSGVYPNSFHWIVRLKKSHGEDAGRCKRSLAERVYEETG